LKKFNCLQDLQWSSAGYGQTDWLNIWILDFVPHLKSMLYIKFSTNKNVDVTLHNLCNYFNLYIYISTSQTLLLTFKVQPTCTVSERVEIGLRYERKLEKS